MATAGQRKGTYGNSVFEWENLRNTFKSVKEIFEMVFLDFEVRVKDFKLFDFGFAFSTPKTLYSNWKTYEK